MDTSIVFAEPNTIGEYTSHAVDDHYGDQWHLHDEKWTEDEEWPGRGGIDAYKAWDKENGDPDVIIAILDSGTDILHEDLEGNIWVNPGEDLDGDGVVWDMDDMNGLDDDGNGLVDDLSGWDFGNGNNDVTGTWFHGTHTAGIAGGGTSSDRGCSLLITAVGDQFVMPEIVDDAILYAAEEGARVILINFVIGQSQAIEEAIYSAYTNEGVFIVASAGNIDQEFLDFPANNEYCFAVGGSTKSEDVTDPILKYSSSNWGNGLMLVAPAEIVISTSMNNTYGSNSQTSVAAPQATATAGLILSRFSDFTADDIAEAMCITAMKLPAYEFDEDKEYGSWNIEVGYGKLNANRAIGIKEDISSNLVLEEGNYIRDEVHVTNNSTLTLAENSRFYLLKTGNLIIDAGATLIIEDDVIVYGDSQNIITVNGNIQVGSGVTFQKYGVGNNPFYGLVLSNSQLITNLNQVNFNQAQLHNYGSELNITDCEFIDCLFIHSYSGDVTVTNCQTINYTKFVFEDLAGGLFNTVTINNCNFIADNTFYHSAIDIWNYKNFFIEDNTINNFYFGIQIWTSGYGFQGNQSIYNNEIFNCQAAGIETFNSTASISSNHVYNNLYGARFYNNSNIALYGNPGATNYDEVNLIADNDSYEVYASSRSFPWYFRYNALFDEDNLGNDYNDPIVYSESCGGILDVSYNCWDDYFVYIDDLFPPTCYLIWPDWCPDGGGQKSSEIALQTFLDGKEYFENEEYTDAENVFEEVIEHYSNSQYAAAAMKELFSLEQFTDSDYNALQLYYETNDSIQADTVLAKLAIFLANKCELELENWQTAIDHFEDIIENPETTEDSIFAIIDLGHTYFLMGDDSASRSIVRGTMEEHIPKSMEAFAEKRNYLLSLLPITKPHHQQENELETMTANKLLQNIPNPFSNTTTIHYKLDEKCLIEIRVYDHLGKIVNSLSQSKKEKGIHFVELEMSGMTSGIYFYSLFVNGKLTDTKKMVVR